MVNMSAVEENPLEKAKKETRKLDKSKTELEKELQILLAKLTKWNIGMDESLIDEEGYPRSDIDVYKVRHARHRIICIRNDLKNIMKKIEENLHIIHSLSKDSQSLGSTSEERSYVRPIARVTNVKENSPAEEAGLQTGDYILAFGSIQADNFEGITEVGQLVLHSIDRSIKVVIERDEKRFTLYLTPHKWAGQGVLGCVIYPTERVER